MNPDTAEWMRRILADFVFRWWTPVVLILWWLALRAYFRRRPR